MSLIKCNKCGEVYSDSYKKCPFCVEDEEYYNGKVKKRGHRQMEKRKKAPSVVGPVLVLAVLVYTCAKSAPWGYLCGGVAMVVGFLKYRNIVQYNSLTVKRFKNTYKEEMDVKKFNKFVETHF